MLSTVGFWETLKSIGISVYKCFGKDVESFV